MTQIVKYFQWDLEEIKGFVLDSHFLPLSIRLGRFISSPSLDLELVYEIAEALLSFDPTRVQQVRHRMPLLLSS